MRIMSHECSAANDESAMVKQVSLAQVEKYKKTMECKNIFCD